MKKVDTHKLVERNLVMFRQHRSDCFVYFIVFALMLVASVYTCIVNFNLTYQMFALLAIVAFEVAGIESLNGMKRCNLAIDMLNEADKLKEFIWEGEENES